jgi:6-phosphogluconolactonase/glucosamine-6-phosphate isomerase/deaminase
MYSCTKDGIICTIEPSQRAFNHDNADQEAVLIFNDAPKRRIAIGSAYLSQKPPATLSSVIQPASSTTPINQIVLFSF